MRFHGIILLRDEIDVLPETVTHLLEWIDSLYVLDLGSVDGTWEFVQGLAAKEPRIKPFEHAPIVYSDNLRSYVFDRVRSAFSPDDWVMKIDADEIYHVPPPQFVKERLSAAEGQVHLQWYFFRLTQQEVAEYESGRIDTDTDRQRPISDRRRYYKISTYHEPRMFKYRPTMQWPETTSFPYNAGLLARERMPIRHYPHRDPRQMQARFDLRAAQMKLRAHAGGHWKLQDWRKELVDANGVAAASVGQAVGLSGENGIDTGPLLYWEPGTPLPERRLYNHTPSPAKRLVQRLAYATVVPWKDRSRPQFSSTFKPTLEPSLPRDLP